MSKSNLDQIIQQLKDQGILDPLEVDTPFYTLVKDRNGRWTPFLVFHVKNTGLRNDCYPRALNTFIGFPLYDSPRRLMKVLEHKSKQKAPRYNTS